MDRMQHLVNSSASVGCSCAPAARVNRPVPAFTATSVFNGEFKQVFFFYPLDFTFVCPTEIIEFSDRIEEFKALNCEVLGASVDSKFSHLAWLDTPRKKGGLGQIAYPLVSDLNQQISKKFGVYMEENGHTLRGLFIVSDKGIIRHISMNDPPVSRNISEVLRLVAGYQFNDAHGEVCPAGWAKAGDATIKPNPIQKIEYFEAKNSGAKL